MIIATLATMPSRKNLVVSTIESLRHQVDLVFVALNYPKGSSRLPKYQNVEYFYTEPSRGDASKFYPILNVRDSYILSCDDDIAYPDTYAEDMVEAVNVFGTVCSLLGMAIHNFPIKHYYNDRDRITVLPALDGFDKNTYVHIVGTGVAAWHTDMIQLTEKDFPIPNMADIWFSIACRRAKIRPIAVRHPNDYLQYLYPSKTIFDDRRNDDKVETDIVNKYLSGWF